MESLIWLRPHWLWALIPLGALIFWQIRRPALGAWGGVIDPTMLGVLRRLGWTHAARGWGEGLWISLAAAATICALSGPAILREGAGALKRLDPLILVLDLSPSIVSAPPALTQLQTAAMRLLAQAEGRPVGVMAYGADAYLLSAPTQDASTLEGMIALLGPDTLPVVGSRPDMALSMARDLFPAGNKGPGLGGADLVVISDGGGMGPRAVEEAARLQGIGARVWAVSIDQTAPAAPPPDLEALRRLTDAGSGQLRSEPQAGDLARAITQAAKARLIADPTSARAWRDLGPWILGVAMLLLVPIYRRERG